MGNNKIVSNRRASLWRVWSPEYNRVWTNVSHTKHYVIKISAQWQEFWNEMLAELINLLIVIMYILYMQKFCEDIFSRFCLLRPLQNSVLCEKSIAGVLRLRRSKMVDQISSIFSSTDQSRLLTSCCAKQLTRISGGIFISPPKQKRRGHLWDSQLFQASIRRRGSLISLSADLLSPHPFYFLLWPSISWKLNYSAIVSVGHRVTSTLIRFHQQFFALAMLCFMGLNVWWFIHRTHSSKIAVAKQLQLTEFTQNFSVLLKVYLF